MKIVVLVKDVPDTGGDRALDLETGLLDRAGSERVLDEICERALEVVLSYKESSEAEVTVLSMGPAEAAASIRRGLAMGADSAVQVAGDELVGADIGLTAEVLAAAIQRIGFDLVVAGNMSTDGSGGTVPAMIAELLDVPALTSLSRVEITADGVSGTRVTEVGTVDLSSGFPALVSVTEALPEARFPSLKGIMAAKKKTIETVSLDGLGVEVLGATPRAIMTEVSETPPRGAGVKITDEGDAGEQLAEFLVTNRLI